MTMKPVRCGCRNIQHDAQCCLPAVVDALEAMLATTSHMVIDYAPCDECRAIIKARAALALAYGEGK